MKDDDTQLYLSMKPDETNRLSERTRITDSGTQKDRADKEKRDRRQTMTGVCVVWCKVYCGAYKSGSLCCGL